MKKSSIIFKLFIVLFSAFLILSCDDLSDPDEPGNLVPKTVMEDPLLPRIEVNGTLLHAESFGDIHDPVIIFLHGGPGSDYRAFIYASRGESSLRQPAAGGKSRQATCEVRLRSSHAVAGGGQNLRRRPAHKPAGW